ncbi:unnamed protein product [Parascedosporium putredinis]|uniref:Uncharacterized protein n=1 Tax=Parascedosporium putredinis TaxID=1442378 RepID=A0A9P1H9C0_9PEZI|nr:unnamed protein product [Parascedosporium putredinis]CAI8001533.1 unnamed protein product [Parascedosporium putredinis]
MSKAVSTLYEMPGSSGSGAGASFDAAVQQVPPVAVEAVVGDQSARVLDEGLKGLEVVVRRGEEERRPAVPPRALVVGRAELEKGLDVGRRANGGGPVQRRPPPLVAGVDLGKSVGEAEAQEIERLLGPPVGYPEVREHRVPVAINVLDVGSLREEGPRDIEVPMEERRLKCCPSGR